VKGEFVNIGVVLQEAGAGGAGTRTAVRFTRDWGRVRCVDADADIGMLEGLEQELLRRFESGITLRDAKGIMAILEDTLSNSVQITNAKGTLAENMATEMESLMGLHIESRRTAKSRRKSGRALILQEMRREFDAMGVWGSMDHQIRASQFTRSGDPLRIDCGYPVTAKQATADEIVRMFQAISLETDVEAAKGLAFSAPQLRVGVERVKRAQLRLSAVVEPLRMLGNPEDESNEDIQRYRFGVEAMEAQEIRVITVNDLRGAAETAQRELGLVS